MLIAAIAAAVYASHRLLRARSPAHEDALTYTVKSATLKVTVSERGNLESQKTVDGICELDGRQNKIIFIADEGSHVKEGDVVVRFDSSEIDKEIKEQEIKVTQAQGDVAAKEQEVEVQRNQNESDIAAAKLELTLSSLDLRKYKEGDYLVKLYELEGKIALAEFELEKAKDAYMHLQELVKSGYRQPEQLQGAKQSVESAKYNLQRDKEQLRVLKNFEHERSLTEFTSKAEDAVRKLDRTRASARAQLLKAESAHQASRSTLRMQEERLADLIEQKSKCELKAPQEGIVAYANDRPWDESSRIREGALVYNRQTIFRLPDMTGMQVKVNVHESMVKKVKPDQSVTIRVDAFPTLAIRGTVKKVSPLADSEGWWGRGGVKEYTTYVTVDETPSVPLRPGMTAEVEIAVGTFADVLAVPVQAVTEQGRSHLVFVQHQNQFEPQEVHIGESNYKLVQIVEGLSAGQVVALDARARALASMGDEKWDDTEEEELAPAAAPATTAELDGVKPVDAVVVSPGA